MHKLDEGRNLEQLSHPSNSQAMKLQLVFLYGYIASTSTQKSTTVEEISY